MKVSAILVLTFFILIILIQKYSVNIAISKSKNIKEPWIIITNGDHKMSIKDYGNRFGGIETLF